MKKLIVSLLALMMLLSMGSGFVSAAEADGVETVFADDVEIVPFTAVVTEKVKESLYPAHNIDDIISITTDVKDGKVVLVEAGVPAGMDNLVAYVKKAMEARPEGLRHLYVWAIGRPFDFAPEDVIYLQEGVEDAKVLLDEFFEAYAASGAPALDGVFTDLEYNACGSWYLQQQLTENPNLYQDIIDNPRYETEVRPLLEAYDFKFYENDDNGSYPEIWGIYPQSGETYAASRAVWDTVMRIRLNQYLDYMLFDTVAKYFPEAATGDYQSADFYAWFKRTTDTENKTLAGNEQNAGNTSTYSFYGSRPTTEGNFLQPIGYNKAVYEEKPFNATLWEFNLARNSYASSDTQNFSPFIAGYTQSYPMGKKGTYANTAYYSELVLHFGMLDPDPFLVYAYKPEYASEKDYNTNMGVISQLLAELTRVAGAADRDPIVLPLNWNASFLLSGMYSGGRNIWRITPDTDIKSVKDFKVNGDDPTFSINGQTITFPQGKIIEDSKIDKIGTCGYWVETPKDVMPVITNDADRFEKYPAFEENFDGYKAGTKFNASTGLPKTAWEVVAKANSSSVIQTSKDNAKDLVLALTGDVTAKSLKIPALITAGDTYAEKQAWEISITLPAGLNSDAELVLLNAAGMKLAPADNGLKIAGGKVYYDNGGEYTQMKGVDLSAGGTYTVKRVADFNNPEAFTSDYYIIDAEGKTVGEAKNVPMANLTLPIQSIGFSCAKVSGEPVLVNGYKLYAAGVAQDLELYDAVNGKLLEENELPREKDTAYRLSWMNASGKEKTVSVVAAYYKGDKLVSQEVIQELVMAPGGDGIETGIVKNEKDGHTMVIRLLDGDADSNKKSASIDPLMLVVIIAGVVAVALIAVALLMPSKKKAAPEAKAEEVTEEAAEETAEEATEENTEE